jgi:hypothetical protein
MTQSNAGSRRDDRHLAGLLEALPHWTTACSRMNSMTGFHQQSCAALRACMKDQFMEIVRCCKGGAA